MSRMIIERYFKDDISCYVYRATIGTQIAISSDIAAMMHGDGVQDFIFCEIKSRMMRAVYDADSAEIVNGCTPIKDICRNCYGNIDRDFNYCPNCGAKVVSE